MNGISTKALALGAALTKAVEESHGNRNNSFIVVESETAGLYDVLPGFVTTARRTVAIVNADEGAEKALTTPRYTPEQIEHACDALNAGLAYWDALRNLETSLGDDVEVEHTDLDALMSTLDAVADESHAITLLDELAARPVQS